MKEQLSGIARFRKGSANNRLYARSYRINTLIFLLTLCIMTAIIMVAFSAATESISSDYAMSYAGGSAEALSARVDRELGLMTTAARSDAVIDWMSDEKNVQKRELAYREIANIVGELYSFNVYVGVNSSLNEYQVTSGRIPEEFTHVSVLSESDPLDSWYFECMRSEDNYILSVDIDHIMQRKRVWLDCKVVKDGVPVGTICTGLEFSHVAGELFSHRSNTRAFLLDTNGIIHIDSSLMGNKDFLYSKFEKPISGEFTDKALLSFISSGLKDAASDSQNALRSSGMKLSQSNYRYAAMVSVPLTDWVVLTLTGDTGLVDMTVFIAAGVGIIILLTSFNLVTRIVNARLIFKPLDRLASSLTMLHEDRCESIYGVERDDELGNLSKTIMELFNEANMDALTGIYNRRFMESHLERLMGVLSRSGSLLSIFMIDIDFFKRYNDTYGHDQGDVCLRAVAQALSLPIERAGDFAARYGGEEFLIVLPNTDEAGARLVASKLLASVRELKISHAKNDAAPIITISIGVSTCKVEYGLVWENCVKRADEALYMSKQGGRNRYTMLLSETEDEQEKIGKI